MKKLISFLVTIILIAANLSFTTVKTKPTVGLISYSFIVWTTYADHISYECHLDQANSVDYNVVVGVWVYQHGRYYVPGWPMPVIGWHWAYRYYNLVIPAGITYTNTEIEGAFWGVSAGEDVDTQNFYIYSYQPA